MPVTEKICLIVDDEPTIRTYLRAIVKRQGIHTLEAENAAQAFRLVKKLNGAVDLVITDVLMPGDMDGFDLAHAVRDAFPSTAVLVITGYETTLTDARKGDFLVIQKPFKPEELLEAAHKLMGSV